MDDLNRVNSGETQTYDPHSTENRTVNLPEQHVTTLPLQGAFVVDAKTSLITYMFHWTARFKVMEMTPRKAAILLKVLMFEFLAKGLDLSGYIAVEFLVSYVQGSKRDPLEVYDERDRQACLLGNLILANIRGTWLTLDERIKIPPAIQQEILNSGWLPDVRTWNSWKQFWNVRSFIEILTVPLDTYNERELSTSPYSSYTKGYGNGGHISRVKKTPYDSELDGESTDREPPVFTLQEIDTYNRLLFLLERSKAERIQGQK